MGLLELRTGVGGHGYSDMLREYEGVFEPYTGVGHADRFGVRDDDDCLRLLGRLFLLPLYEPVAWLRRTVGMDRVRRGVSRSILPVTSGPRMSPFCLIGTTSTSE